MAGSASAALHQLHALTTNFEQRRVSKSAINNSEVHASFHPRTQSIIRASPRFFIASHRLSTLRLSKSLFCALVVINTAIVCW